MVRTDTGPPADTSSSQPPLPSSGCVQRCWQSAPSRQWTETYPESDGAVFRTGHPLVDELVPFDLGKEAEEEEVTVLCLTNTPLTCVTSPL